MVPSSYIWLQNISPSAGGSTLHTCSPVWMVDLCGQDFFAVPKFINTAEDSAMLIHLTFWNDWALNLSWNLLSLVSVFRTSPEMKISGKCLGTSRFRLGRFQASNLLVDHCRAGLGEGTCVWGYWIQGFEPPAVSAFPILFPYDHLHGIIVCLLLSGS